MISLETLWFMLLTSSQIVGKISQTGQLQQISMIISIQMFVCFLDEKIRGGLIKLINQFESI